MIFLCTCIRIVSCVTIPALFLYLYRPITTCGYFLEKKILALVHVSFCSLQQNGFNLPPRVPTYLVAAAPTKRLGANQVFISYVINYMGVVSRWSYFLSFLTHVFAGLFVRLWSHWRLPISEDKVLATHFRYSSKKALVAISFDKTDRIVPWYELPHRLQIGYRSSSWSWSALASTLSSSLRLIWISFCFLADDVHPDPDHVSNKLCCLLLITYCTRVLTPINN